MTVIYVSDFDLRGSGYMNIGINLCNQLVKNGYEVLALGLGYNGQEHLNPFTIIPAQMQDIFPMIQQLKAEKEIEAIIVALDIPLQERLLGQLQIPSDIPYIGLFPIEAGPFCMSWAMNVLKMDARLIMSVFGKEELAKVGVDSTFIPIGVDFDSWRVPLPEERLNIRQKLGVEEDTFVVLTVADNQERKNLSRSMEIFADFSKNRKAVYWMVTRPNSIVGWKLQDYAMSLGIMDRFMVWERGITFKELWSLYAGADIMLLTSKAEGLAMPVMEAMACRLPVAGTKCAAIEEHLENDRGLLIQPDYVIVDPWGNSNRYLASREEGVYALKLWDTGMTVGDNAKILDNAEQYIHNREWNKAGEVLTETIQKASRNGTA